MGEYGDSFYYIERGDIFFNLWYVLVLETFWQCPYQYKIPCISCIKVFTLQMHRVVAFLKKQMVASFQVNKICTYLKANAPKIQITTFE